MLPRTLLAVALLAVPAPAADDGPPTYERDIRPLFARKCNGCHSAAKKADLDVSAGLALDSFDATLAGTVDHPVVVPGKPAESELFNRFFDDDEDRRMPLLDRPLPDDQRELVRRWIEAGAPRGEPVAAAPRAARRLVRSLDVAIPVEAKIPAGTPGLEKGGAATLRLKVGPLPPVSALAFRGDGRQLAVGTYGRVVVWDLNTCSPAVSLDDLPGPVHALQFSRDGRRLILAAGLPARSGEVRVYSVPDGSLIHAFEGHSDVVFGLALRPDGGQLASASFDQTVRLWDLVAGRPAGVFSGHSDFVYDVAYAPDGLSAISVGKDRAAKRFDAGAARELRTYSDHNDDVLAIAVRPDGGGFVTAGNEPQLRWWGFEDEKPSKRVGGHGGPVHQLAFSADGSRLISASGDRTVRVWDGRTGALQRTLAGPAEWQYAATLSADGKLAAAGGWDGLVRVWDADKGDLLGTLIQPPGASPADRDWLAVARGGTLAGSPAMLDLLRWQVGSEPVPAELAARLFARPPGADFAPGPAEPAPSP